ncbi:hypothetical protein CBR65_11255 [Cellvibrio sp. PSBB006]|nr:hypothetical protein CBR65_11255 [Cellvibrio sp. PSBB006]
MEFIGTTDGGCDYLFYQDCDPVTHSWILGNKARDSTLAIGGYAYYAIKNGTETSEVVLRTDDLPVRRGAESFAFNDKLWIIGGYESGARNDIWSSVDGANWKIELEQGAFSGREYHRVAHFNNQLWLIGGDSSKGPTNDVWSSSDGINWTLRNANSPFSPRYGHALVAFNGKLWLIGGEDDESWFGDIWSSSNGINWVQETDLAVFGARTSFEVIEFEGQLLLSGGYGESGRTNDIWTSLDGVNWSLAIEYANFSRRYGHAIHEVDGRLWLTGGSTDDLSVDEIWWSDDGVIWEQSMATLPDTYFEHRVLTLNDQLYMVGGFLRNTIWNSTDSLTWENLTSRTVVPDACRFYTFNDQLYAASRGLLWRANDIKDWELLPATTPLPAQGICSLVAHGEKLYVVGGFAGPGDFRRDVWSSTDGETWEQILSPAPFSSRANQTMVSFNGKIWMIGGNDLFTTFEEVWASTDGIEWEQVDLLGLPTSRIFHKQFFVFNDKLWFIGIYGTAEQELVAYSTADGVTWQPEVLNDLVITGNFAITFYNQKLWLFNRGTTHRAIYSSVDGSNWTAEYENVPFWLSHLFVWNDQLTVIGQTLQPGGSWLSGVNDLWMQDNDLEWRRASVGKFIFRVTD